MDCQLNAKPCSLLAPQGRSTRIDRDRDGDRDNTNLIARRGSRGTEPNIIAVALHDGAMRLSTMTDRERDKDLNARRGSRGTEPNIMAVALHDGAMRLSQRGGEP